MTPIPNEQLPRGDRDDTDEKIKARPPASSRPEVTDVEEAAEVGEDGTPYRGPITIVGSVRRGPDLAPRGDIDPRTWLVVVTCPVCGQMRTNQSAAGTLDVPFTCHRCRFSLVVDLAFICGPLDEHGKPTRLPERGDPPSRFEWHAGRESIGAEVWRARDRWEEIGGMVPLDEVSTEEADERHPVTRVPELLDESAEKMTDGLNAMAAAFGVLRDAMELVAGAVAGLAQVLHNIEVEPESEGGGGDQAAPPVMRSFMARRIGGGMRSETKSYSGAGLNHEGAVAQYVAELATEMRWDKTRTISVEVGELNPELDEQPTKGVTLLGTFDAEAGTVRVEKPATGEAEDSGIVVDHGKVSDE